MNKVTLKEKERLRIEKYFDSFLLMSVCAFSLCHLQQKKWISISFLSTGNGRAKILSIYPPSTQEMAEQTFSHWTLNVLIVRILLFNFDQIKWNVDSNAVSLKGFIFTLHQHTVAIIIAFFPKFDNFWKAIMLKKCHKTGFLILFNAIPSLMSSKGLFLKQEMWNTENAQEYRTVMAFWGS